MKTAKGKTKEEDAELEHEKRDGKCQIEKTIKEEKNEGKNVR